MISGFTVASVAVVSICMVLPCAIPNWQCSPPLHAAASHNLRTPRKTTATKYLQDQWRYIINADANGNEYQAVLPVASWTTDYEALVKSSCSFVLDIDERREKDPPKRQQTRNVLYVAYRDPKASSKAGGRGAR